MRGFLALLACIAANACTLASTHREPWVAGGGTPHGAQFCGIRESLEKTKAVRVLVIHGMGWHEYHDYDAALREGLRVELGLEPMGCTGPYAIANKDDLNNVYGGVLRCTYRNHDGALLRIYNLLWSHLTVPYKVGALEYDWSRPHHQHRARLNRKLKEDLINRSFSDAILYAGALREVMQYSVRQAICAAVTDQTDLSQPCSKPPSREETGPSDFFVVTHSLGSAMLFETLREMDSESKNEAAQELVRRVKVVAMLANQLPLIALARHNQPPADDQLTPVSQQFPEMLKARDTPIVIAAFTDNNDLLSFPVPESWRATLSPPGLKDKFLIINYPVVNARFLWLGLFANPAVAHTGYWTNKHVLNALVNGCGCGSPRQSRYRDCRYDK